MNSTIIVHGMEVDPSKLPPGLLEEPPKMCHNPVHCHKFVVNMFKAGSGKCRDCGFEWYQHEGVIDRQVAEKFLQIWTHAQQKAIQAALEPIKTVADMREEKKRALIAAAKLARSGSGSNSNRSSSGGEWFSGSNGEEVDDFKLHSRQELLELEKERHGHGSGRGGKPVKVVNLIDFDESLTKKSPLTLPIRKDSIGASCSSPREEGLRKMEEIEQQVLLMTNEIREKENLINVKNVEVENHKNLVDQLNHKIAQLEASRVTFQQENVSEKQQQANFIEKLKLKVKDQESVIESNKCETRKVLDQLDLVMKDNEVTVRELKRQLEISESKISSSSSSDAVLKERIAELEMKESKLVEVERMFSEQQILSGKLNSDLSASRTEIATIQAGFHDREKVLQVQLSQSESIRAELEKKVEIIHMESQKLYAEREKAFEVQLSQSESIRAELEKKVETMHAESQKLLAEGEKALEVQLSQSESVRTELEKKVETMHVESQKQQSLIAQLSSKVAQLKEQLQESVEKFYDDQSQKLAWQHQIDELEARVQSVEAEREDVVNILQNKLRQSEEETNRFESENKSLLAEIEHARIQLSEVQTEFSSGKERQQSLNRVQAELDQTTSEKEALLTSSKALQDDLKSLREERMTLKAEKNASESHTQSVKVQHERLQESCSNLQTQLNETQNELVLCNSELQSIKSQLGSESNSLRSQIEALRSELEAAGNLLQEARKETARESQTAANATLRSENSNRTIEELKGKIAQYQLQLNEVRKSSNASEHVAKQCDQYLKAIQDVSFVMKTVTDKFISPNNSEANSRAVSIEEDGPEAILQLERHVKAILRLVEAVSDKAKIIEKENEKLEEKCSEYEHLNSSLRERVNQPLMQRLIEPIISCRWSGPSATERILQQSNGMPIKSRGAAEMSNVSGGPPRQVRNMGKD